MNRICAVLCAALLSLLGSCGRKARTVPASQLAFPAILILGTTAPDPASPDIEATGNLAGQARTIADLEQLSHLRVERYLQLSETQRGLPLVIDSQGDLFEMTNIQGQRGSWWMMINPTGLMPIKFDLIPRPERGLEAARAALVRCRYYGYELSDTGIQSRRDKIRTAQSVAEFFDILDEAPRPLQTEEPDTPLNP